MRLRTLIPIALFAVGALLVPACSGDDGGETATADSNQRESTSDTDSGSGDTGGESGETGSDNDPIPDPTDPIEDIPGVPDDLDECMKQAATFSSLYFEALSDEGGADKAKEKAESLKDTLPEDLHDDIDVITEAIGQVAEEGLLSGTDAMESEEFVAAQENIGAYFEEKCSAGG